jgi:hypothetical protein
MKQEYTLRIYKADRRLIRSSGFNRPGWRRVGTHYVVMAEKEIAYKIHELKALYPEPQFSIEYFPTYKTVKNMMTGKDVVIPTDTPRSCDPSSELYWTK